MLCPAKNTSWIQRTAEWLSIAGFVLSCGGLMIGGFIPWSHQSDGLHEKRLASPFPGCELSPRSLKAFPAAFEAYYNDHFGMRSALVRLNAGLRVHGLGVSSSPQVVLGRDGWLFYNGDHALDDHVGRRRWSNDELERIRRGLEARRDWLAARGCDFLFVIAPNKETIYPEYLPSCLPAGQTCRAQLVAYLAEHSTVRVLDLAPALTAARGKRPIYLRTDSHWNDLGAFAAYRALLAALPIAEEPWPRADFAPIVHEYDTGDLADLLGLPRRETIVSLQPRRPRQASISGPRQQRVARNAYGKQPRTLMLCDSFAAALVPFLSEHFTAIEYVWQQELPVALIERRRPRLVIQQIVERSLWPGDFCAPPEAEPAEIAHRDAHLP